MSAAQRLTSHYLDLQRICQFELMSGDVDCEQFAATVAASEVALHYLSEHTSYSEFSAALEQGRVVQDIVRKTLDLTR